MTILWIILGSFGGLFALLGIIGLGYKPVSIFKNHPEQVNPFEGKKVVFVEDANDPVNADGLHGHLEETGDSPEFKSGYLFWKRLMDIVLSFFALVILSPVFLVLIIALEIDDPGPIFFCQKRIGKNKRFFKLHKIRSMKMSTPARCIIGTTPKIA